MRHQFVSIDWGGVGSNYPCPDRRGSLGNADERLHESGRLVMRNRTNWTSLNLHSNV